MKINQIRGYETNSNSTIQKKKEEVNSNFATNSLRVKNTYTDSEISKSYYTNFKAGSTKVLNTDRSKMKSLEGAMSTPAKELIESARKIAKKYGYPVINQTIVLLASLMGLKDYIEQINNGEIDLNDITKYFIPLVIIEETTNDVFKDEEKRETLSEVLDSQIKVLSENIEKNKPSKPAETKSKLILSSDFIGDLISRYNIENSQVGMSDGFVHDSTILSTVFDANRGNFQKNVITPFRMAIKENILVDKSPVSERIHLSFYDEKAKNIWEKLSYHTNIAILEDKETSSEYLINSILDVFENSDSNSRFNKENTKIVNFNDIGYIDDFFIDKKFKEYRKNPDENYIVIMNIMNEENALGIDEVNEEIFNSAPDNVLFIMTADKDEYLKNYQKEELNGFFDNFSDVTIPLMTVQRTKAMFKEQPKLMDEIKKPFDFEAIEKTIELSASQKGNFPEKAQKLMNEISLSFIERDKITKKEVDEYVNTHKDKFKTNDSQNSSIKVVLDTKVKLNDIVGKNSALQDAKLIVDNVLENNHGTKGYLIYSQDGTYGSGRKFIAKAIAGELEAPYIQANGIDFCTENVDIFSLLSGSNSSSLSPEASMKKLFGLVKSQAETNPNKAAVIMFENFAIFSDSNATEYSMKALSQLAREMEDAQEQGFNIIVMGSIPSSEYLEDMNLHSSKFLETIVVDSPAYNNDTRRQIIINELEKQNIKLPEDKKVQDLIINQIVRTTEYSSLSEIKLLIKKAKSVAKERKHDVIDKSDFTEAYLRQTVGRVSGSDDPVHRKELVTSHECGHALNSYIMEEIALKQNRPDHLGYTLNFITLDPRGDYGGAVYSSQMDNNEYSFEHVFSDIIVSFGGTSAEQEFYGQNGSWGITADMENATSRATRAAGIMGQGKFFGKKSLAGVAFISEKDKELLNKDIDVILKNAEVVSGAITKMYADFNKEFTKKYADKVGTGDCIIQREEFIEFLNEWRSKQTPEKQADFASLEADILKVIEATKNGIECYREK